MGNFDDRELVELLRVIYKDVARAPLAHIFPAIFNKIGQLLANKFPVRELAHI